MDRVLRNKKAIAFFVLPGLLAYTIFVFYPMIESVWFTFFEGTPHVKFEFVGLRNYAKLFTDKNFINSFKVNLNIFSLHDLPSREKYFRLFIKKT